MEPHVPRQAAHAVGRRAPLKRKQRLLLHALRQAARLAVRSRLDDLPSWWVFLGPDAPEPYVLTDAGRRVLGSSAARMTKAAFLAQRDVIVRALQAQAAPDVASLAAGMRSGVLAPADVTDALRTLLKQAYTQQYLFGMGGTRHMGPSDWGALGNILRRQYAYMAGFEAYLERQLAAGRVPSAAYMQWRMGLYLQSSRYAFERAHVTSYGLPRNPRWGEKPLPVFPAEPGATECGSNCGCSWQIVVQPEQFECYWELDDTKGKHCEDCIAYNITYYPLVIPRTYYDAFGNEQDVADAPPELWEFLDDGIEGYDLDLYGDVY